MKSPFAAPRRCLAALLLGLPLAAGLPAARGDVLTSRLIDPSPVANGHPAAPGACVEYRARGEDEPGETAGPAGRQTSLSPLAALALVLVIPATATPDLSGGGGGLQNLQNNNQNNNQNQNNGDKSLSIAGSPDTSPVAHAPEPGSLVLGLLGLAGLAVLSRRLSLRPAAA